MSILYINFYIYPYDIYHIILSIYYVHMHIFYVSKLFYRGICYKKSLFNVIE